MRCTSLCLCAFYKTLGASALGLISSEARTTALLPAPTPRHLPAFKTPRRLLKRCFARVRGRRPVESHCGVFVKATSERERGHEFTGPRVHWAVGVRGPPVRASQSGRPDNQGRARPQSRRPDSQGRARASNLEGQNPGPDQALLRPGPGGAPARE
jgi:hypothetical protein